MKKRRLFTLVELLVVTGIISILAGLLLPALDKALSAAHTVTCQGNLKQVAHALVAYGDDHKLYFPAKGSGNLYWFRALGDGYLESTWPTGFNKRPLGVWACSASDKIARAADLFYSDYSKNPATGESAAAPGTDYATNNWVRSNTVRSPSRAFFAIDAESTYYTEYTGRDLYAFLASQRAPAGASPRHEGMANIQYIDGHVASISPYDPVAFPNRANSAGSSQHHEFPWNLMK